MTSQSSYFHRNVKSSIQNVPLLDDDDVTDLWQTQYKSIKSTHKLWPSIVQQIVGKIKAVGQMCLKLRLFLINVIGMKMLIPQKHVWTLRNKTASIKLELKKVPLIFRLLPSSLALKCLPWYLDKEKNKLRKIGELNSSNLEM